MREWKKRAEIYRRYKAVIAPLLPSSVRRLCRDTLHDAVVTSVTQQRGTLKLDMDARGALGGFRGYRVRLTFPVALALPCMYYSTVESWRLRQMSFRYRSCSDTWPNQRTSGNGAVGLWFHSEHSACAVPDSGGGIRRTDSESGASWHYHRLKRRYGARLWRSPAAAATTTRAHLSF